MTIRIANAAGFLGDRVSAPRQLLETADVDYLTLEYLAELTMSILARLRQRDAQQGYAADFLTVAGQIAPFLQERPHLRVVTNAGGVHPLACARALGALLTDAGLADLPVAVVQGDCLTDRIDSLQQAGCSLRNLDTGESFGELPGPVVAAHAYLGAEGIVTALEQDARIVVSGRVADAALTVAPAQFHFPWDTTDWTRLAAAATAGHLIECGAQVTGGYSTRSPNIPLTNVGYPIAELDAEGGVVITKPEQSDGEVNCLNVAQQLVYEIGDPAAYLTPDVTLDLRDVQVEQQGADRVAVRGARGGPPPDDLKVSLAYEAGYKASAQLLVQGNARPGNRAADKARAVAKLVQQRVGELQAFNCEVLGGEAAGGDCSITAAGGEVLLRMAVRDSRREIVERFTREIAPLITSGPAGLAGYAAGRSPVRHVFAYWPTTVPRELVVPEVRVRTASTWADEPSP